MTAIKIVEKKEYFNVGGGVQEYPTFLVRDPEDGSLLFAFRKDSGRWRMTAEEPYGFCVGAQDAPEYAEFKRADFPELQILEDAFNESHEAFLERLMRMGLPHLRNRKAEEAAYWEVVAAKKAVIAAELKVAETADRSDLSAMDLIQVAGGWKLTFPDESNNRLILESLRGTIEIAEFRVSKIRRRVEFRILSDGVDLAPALSPEKWVNPWLHKLDDLPASLRKIIVPTFQALSGGMAKVLPEPRLPKETQGQTFKGKGLSYFIKQLELIGGEYTLQQACLDAYGTRGSGVETTILTPIWIMAKKTVMARKLAKMGFLWPISKEALAHEGRVAAERAHQGINDLYAPEGLPTGVYGFRIQSDPGFRVLPGFNWDAWLTSI